MKRRQLLALLVAGPGVFGGLPGCGRGPAIDVGLHPWPGYDPLLLARHFGWLGDAVRLSEGRNAGDSIDGLHSGRLAAACLTLDEVLGVRARSLPLTVILVMNESAGADVVLARPEIGLLSDLKGRRIAVETGALGGLVLHKTLAAAGLRTGDVELVDAAPSDQWPLWEVGSIDAAISYPPFSTRLEAAGARRLYDSRQFPHTIFDVLAVRSDRLKASAAAWRDLVGGYVRALDHLRANREDALRRLAAWRDIRFEEAEAGYRGLHLPTVGESRRLMAQDGELLRAARTLNQVMQALGLLPRADSLEGLVSQQFIPAER